MKLSIVTNVLAVALIGAVGGGLANAQHISDGLGYRGVQFAGGGGPYLLDQGVMYAGCDACDAYGNSIDPGCGDCAGGCGYDGGCCGCDGGCCGCDGYGGFGTYGAGGGYDQCGPHYFDFSADFLFWKRDKATGPLQPLSSEGIGVLNLFNTINGLEFEYEPGVKLTARLDIGPATIVEGTYFGTFHWTRNTFSGPPAQSLYTNYGNSNRNLYPDTDTTDTSISVLHSLTYNTQLNNAEINWRQYWVANAPRVTGTYLIGARYLRLREDLLFYTLSTDDTAPFDTVGWMRNSVATENDLVGFQVGADAAICLTQGLRIVSEGKAGIYNNRSKNRSLVVGENLARTDDQLLSGNNVAFVGEASVGFVADILPSLSVRGGYQVLYFNAVTLAGDNFNTEDPYYTDPGAAEVRTVPRNVVLRDTGTLLFHGLYGGLEYIW